MTHTYNISGMTCGNCVAKAKSALLKLGEVTQAEVQLAAPQATVTMQQHIPLASLQAALSKAGSYTITEADGGMHHSIVDEETRSLFETYKPIIVICAYITGVTVLIEGLREYFNVTHWMHNFMAAFFLVFSFFKMLDLRGFADSYSTYDIIAKRWHGWGYLYAFVELALGLAYLLRFDPVVTNAATFVVMSISIIGVLQSIVNKKKIRCACLGAVFNLPMSTITIVEDGLMIAMSAAMLVVMNF